MNNKSVEPIHLARAVLSFKEALTKLCNENNPVEFEQIRIESEEGPKFVRIVRVIVRRDSGQIVSRSAHCFIEKETGNILKAAGWKAPEKKNPRGNVFAENPLQGVTQYGVTYLR